MTRRPSPQFRVAPPTLEPGPVLLHQLAELSMSSRPAARTARNAGMRALAGAATVALIGGTTWVAGAAPGSDPTRGTTERAVHTQAGVASTGGTDVEDPQPDVETLAPGSPWSPGLPGHETSVLEDAPPSDDPDRSGGPREPGQQPANEGRGQGKDKGRGDGTGNGHGQGHAYGHDRDRGGKAKDDQARSDKGAEPKKDKGDKPKKPKKDTARHGKGHR